MKPKKQPALQPALALPEGFTLNLMLNQRYNEQPLFKDKIDRANHILKTVGLPKTKLA